MCGVTELLYDKNYREAEGSPWLLLELCALCWELMLLTCAAGRCVLPADPGQGAFFGDILIYVCCLDCFTTAVMSYFSKYFYFEYDIQNSNLSGSLGLVWIWVLAISECKVAKQNVLA